MEQEIREALTRETILAMQPGRELDELVMTKFFEARKAYHGDEELWYHYDENGKPDYEWRFYNSPSTDIAAAWGVFQDMRNKLFSDRREFMNELTQIIRDEHKASIAWPDLMWFIEPEHICKAALLATLEDNK